MTYDEIFENIGTIYAFDTNIENLSMDNVDSMDYFLNEIALVPDEMIVIYDGTQVILKHNDYDFLVQLDSYGRGDFYSHAIEISKYEE